MRLFLILAFPTLFPLIQNKDAELGEERSCAMAFAPHSSSSSLLLEQQLGRAAGKEGVDAAGSRRNSELGEHPAARAGVTELFLTQRNTFIS